MKVVKPRPLPGSDAASGWYPVCVGRRWRVARDYWSNVGGGTYPSYARLPGNRYAEYLFRRSAQHAADLLNGGSA